MWGRSLPKASHRRAGVRVHGLAFALLGPWLVLAAACGAPVDPSFASPEATLRTLLRSHRLDGLNAGEIRGRLARRERMRVADPELMRACFVTLREDPEDQGLAGFVVGAAGAARDRWRTAITGDRANVAAGPRATIRLVRGDDGAWRIDLHRSVPLVVQQQMAELGRRVRERNARDGIPVEL